MLPTVTGLVVIALGIWCQFGSPSRALVVMLGLTLFEAADAADLIALGGQSVTPAKLFLAFFVLRLLSMRAGGSALLAEIAPRRVLFIYLRGVVQVVRRERVGRARDDLRELILVRADFDAGFRSRGRLPAHPDRSGGRRLQIGADF